MNVIVAPHDPKWAESFVIESRAITSALGPNVLAVHHIGSTAIPAVVAKPVIDMLVVVTDLPLVDSHTNEMQELGYEAKGEFGIPGRRYFRKDDSKGVRTHHVHVYAQGNHEIERHLNFRDFLNVHPQWAAKYSELKLRLVEENRKTGKNYQDGKGDFIRKLDFLAAKWSET
ncbi:MAG: GrpB family protein [Pirellulaceae bacterium]|nr:GrpB family protein [Pirellulaceae bacterium]